MIPDRSFHRAVAGLRAWWSEATADYTDADLDAELRDEPIDLMEWRRGRASDLHPGSDE